MSKVVPGTVPKGRGTRRAGGRGAVAELRSSGTGWVGRPVSPGAGRASKSGPADRKAGREKQRAPEIGAWSGEALSPRYQAQGLCTRVLCRGLVLSGRIPGPNGLSPTPEGQDPQPPEKSPGDRGGVAESVVVTHRALRVRLSSGSGKPLVGIDSRL